jgi:carbon storage regulator
MLVLSRKRGETIVIGDRIRVTVEGITGGRVRLSISAPADVSVDREEIWWRKRTESDKAVETGVSARFCLSLDN